MENFARGGKFAMGGKFCYGWEILLGVENFAISGKFCYRWKILLSVGNFAIGGKRRCPASAVGGDRQVAASKEICLKEIDLANMVLHEFKTIEVPKCLF